MVSREFLLPINLKKSKKLWKFGFFNLWPLFGLQKIFGLFSIFLAFRHLEYSKLFKFELFWSNFAIKTVFAETFAAWISVSSQIHNSGHTNVAPSDEINKDAVWRNDAVLKLSLIKLYSFHMTDYNFEHNSL